jgi:arylsulfatase A-like enzyme
MAGPGVAAGERAPRPVSVIDIPDTVCDALGIDRMASSQGTSQWRRPVGFEPDRAVFAEWRHYRLVLDPDKVDPRVDFLVSVQLEGAKLILPMLPGGRPMLFDHESDPDEMVNVVDDRPELAQRLASVHRRHVDDDLPLGLLGAAGAELDDESLDMLRELGYID